MPKLTSALLGFILAAGCDSPGSLPTVPQTNRPELAPPAVNQYNTRLDLAGTFWNGCFGSSGEYVAVSGGLHIRGQWMYDPDTGEFRMRFHENMQGVTGTGEASGLRYEIMYSYNIVDISSPGPEYDADRNLKMRMTSQGSADNSDFHVIYNIHYDPVNGYVFTLKKEYISCGG